ncbi:alginate lyase [Vibrio sp. UCD-FRSSP16_10]|uniref:polysaccharide lyase family 7 protein n=1 Tax=unclassified Vibrio TaxID=2614977 RepID=UPI0007FBA40B|nr:MULTISPECIES: polysaccharide lyase family 7 protein [unclassified Vibrio]OBT17211.1 alginate lyase [Vibrio sp. UCD-FRSSP16_30]OBT22980.1 alginate lyase [Vibrio sp. UCD-FRSSP16_10]
MHTKNKIAAVVVSALVAGLAGCSTATSHDTASAKSTSQDSQLAAKYNLDVNKVPAQNFDLSKFKLNLPMDDDKAERAGKVMEIYKPMLNSKEQPFSQADWFYTDSVTGAMVFAAPNKAMTTPNSKNARSELRAMLADDYATPKNNFTIASTKDAEKYGAIGGHMSATLAVDWVSTSGDYKKGGAFATVIGQIHASHNEPLKIVYRKLPGHEYGSVYWNYETNAKGDDYKHRHDISTDVFGQNGLRKGSTDPVDGIKLGEIFSYDVNVEGDIMHLTFVKNPGTANKEVRKFDIDLAKGHVDGDQYDQGYANDYLYFKAGNYNQCNTGSTKCSNNGIEAGDYAKVSFYKLNLDQ